MQGVMDGALQDHVQWFHCPRTNPLVCPHPFTAPAVPPFPECQSWDHRGLFTLAPFSELHFLASSTSLPGLKAHVFLELSNTPLSRWTHTFFTYKTVSSPLSTSRVFCEIKEVNNTRALGKFRHKGGPWAHGTAMRMYRGAFPCPGLHTSESRVLRQGTALRSAQSLRFARTHCSIETPSAKSTLCTPAVLAITSLCRGPSLLPQHLSRGQRWTVPTASTPPRSFIQCPR